MAEGNRRIALIVVDMQPDFMEGGPLATEDGSAIIPDIRALMLSGQYTDIVAIQDWHPAGHVSFANSHDAEPFTLTQLYGHDQVLWPDHCVQTTPGAQLHADLPWEMASVIIRKGEDPWVDSYSGFANNWDAAGERPATGLAGWLRERGITAVDCCGLARDYCVKWTAEDAVAMGFETRFLWDLTRPVDSNADTDVRTALDQAGVGVIRGDGRSQPS
ncbi:UNVERIFIED_CONTAM: bifunctional nicotinamidase/pyrazinamidase [Spiribacter pallidus]